MPKSSTAWQIGRKHEEEEYKRILFSEFRLRLRRFTFANITVPSIVAATQSASEVSTEVHVLASELLPQRDRDFLHSLSREHPFIRVFLYNEDILELNQSTAAYLDSVDTGDIVASIRIDDDDAVSKSFLKQLSEYMIPELDGFIISLCSGYGGILDEHNRISAMGVYNWRFGSVGLSMIMKKTHTSELRTIYSVGNHKHTDSKRPTILDARQPSLFRAFHAGNDSKASFEKSVPVNLKGEELRNAQNLFGMAPEAWSV